MFFESELISKNRRLSTLIFFTEVLEAVDVSEAATETVSRSRGDLLSSYAISTSLYPFSLALLSLVISWSPTEAWSLMMNAM